MKYELGLQIPNKRLWLKALFLVSVTSIIVLFLFSLIHSTVITNGNDRVQIDTTQFKSKPLNIEDQNVGKIPSYESLKRRPLRAPLVLNNEEIKSRIALINRQQTILNEEIYGSTEDYSLVIIVQVHSRIEYLKYLISSLRDARDINSALLIFSHDFFDENINILIESIDFCRVLQIFYPYSIQLYPNQFPGSDPKDCSRDTPKDEAVTKGCLNAFFIDLGGKYRTPKLTQVKHHWWWKANRVFNLEAVRMYDGPVLFLEEDLFVVEDFIPMMRLMYNTTKLSCKDCKIFSLAASEDAVNSNRADYRRSNQAIITSIFNNLGLAFSRAAWAEMVDCANVFCTFDDYNWDFSLKYVFTNCMKNTAAVNLKSPRVFHLGACGVHFTSGNCNADEKVETIKRMLQNNKKYLYPDKLTLLDNNHHVRSYSKYGGFADPRDHALCMGMTIM